jgi:PASTA domain
MRASVSRTTLVAVLAAAAFSTATTAAHADMMTAGTWDGQVTGGTLSIGDGDLQSIAVPAGDSFVVTIPAAAAAPVAFRAPATHIPIPAHTFTDTPGTWTASGSLDVSPIDGTVDPATGAIAGTASAHGLLRLDFTGAGGSSSLYCQLGDTPSPAPPSPFALNLAGTAVSGEATLADTTFALQLNCGAPFITPDLDLEVVGHPVMPSGSNALSLTVKFTRRADPTPPATKPTTTTTKPKTTVTTPPVQCVVPKLKGLKLKQARAAAKRANCAVGTVKRKKSAKKRTTVLKQGTAAGSVLANGTKIKLTVAK